MSVFRTAMAERKVGLTVVGNDFMQLTIFAKAVQDAINRNAVDFSCQFLFNIFVA